MLIANCKKHNFDGIVLHQDIFCPEQEALLRKARELDKQLVIISQGFDISDAKQVLGRLDAGATAIQTISPIFFSGPSAIYEMKQELRAELKKRLN